MVLANKQDLPGARDPKELETILGLHEIVAPAVHIYNSSNTTISSSSSTGNISGCGSSNSIGSGTGSGTSQSNTMYCTGCPLPTSSKVRYGKCCTSITPDNVCSQLQGDVIRKTHIVRKEDDPSATNISGSGNTVTRDQSPLPTTKSDSLSSMLDKASFCPRRSTQQKTSPVSGNPATASTITHVSGLRSSTSMIPTSIVGAHSSPSSLASTPTATMANTNFATTTTTTTPPPTSTSNSWFSGKGETSETGQHHQHHHHQHHHHTKSKSTASSNASGHHLCWPSYKSWHIQPACAITGEGLQEGLEALYDMIQRRRKWHKAHKKKR